MPNYSNINYAPHRSVFSRLNQNVDHNQHYGRSYPRRFHFPNNRQMPYLPHQWLYNRQQVMQEIYRRHMFNDFDNALYDGRYFVPHNRSRENYHGFRMNERASLESFDLRRSSHLPQYYRPFDLVSSCYIKDKTLTKLSFFLHGLFSHPKIYYLAIIFQVIGALYKEELH